MSAERANQIANAEQADINAKRRSFSLFWVSILGLILLLTAALFETVDWDQRILGWFLFRIDPRYWPLWPIPALWGIVAWLVAGTLDRFEIVRRRQGWIKVLIITGTLCWVAWLGGWTALRVRRMIYQQLYVAYIMGPISQYLVDGTMSWKLLISPTLAVIVIGSLLYVAHKQQKKNHESKFRIEKSGDIVE